MLLTVGNDQNKEWDQKKDLHQERLMEKKVLHACRRYKIGKDESAK